MSRDQLQAFTELYESHADAVYRYAARRSGKETAEEVFAKVFAIAWRRRESLPAEPLPWLYGAARRVLAEQRRGELRRRRLQDRLRSTPVVERAEETAVLELDDAPLSRALAQLSDGDRELLLLTYWEELTPAQVAQAAGCSRATLAVRLHRARVRLRQQLEAAGTSAGVVRKPMHDRACATETEST